MKQFYTYLHCWPATKIPFYVGKGCGNRAAFLKKRNKKHLNYIERCGGIDKIHIIKYEMDSEKQALELEIELIYILKILLKLDICNLTLGGDGVSGYKHTEDTKQKIGKANTTERLVKLHASNVGRKCTQDAKQRIRLSKLGKACSVEVKKKLSLALLGNKLSMETRKNQSLGQKRRQTKLRFKKLIQQNLADIPYMPRAVNFSVA